MGQNRTGGAGEDIVLKVPVGALFRRGPQWAAFRIVAGKAQSVQVSVGQMNADEAEVLSGLSEGDEVITHPPNTLKDGDPVAPR